MLNRTPVSDLSPLRGLRRLRVLGLARTDVRDLTPLTDLAGLVDQPDPPGLTFTGCAAAKADPRIQQIAEIRDPAARARALFVHLSAPRRAHDSH